MDGIFMRVAHKNPIHSNNIDGASCQQGDDEKGNYGFGHHQHFGLMGDRRGRGRAEGGSRIEGQKEVIEIAGNPGSSFAISLLWKNECFPIQQTQLLMQC